MAATAASLAILFESNADQQGREIDRLGSKVKGLGGMMRTALGTGAGFIGAQVITGIVRGAVNQVQSIVNAASDLNETKNKALQVFGADLDKGLVDWAKDAAQTVGLSREQAMAAVATSGNFFQAQGIDASTALKEGEQLVQLAADLGSFNNIDPKEVLQNLSSGLAGEAEPLRKYGIDVSDAAIQNEALAEGISKSTTEMTMAEKSQLRYNIIMKQTTKAQGDFARTSDGLANKQRIFAAKILDLKAVLGSALLPVFTAMAGAGIALVTGFEHLAHTVGSLIDVFRDAFNSGIKVNDLVAKLPTSLQGVGKAFLLVADAAGYLFRTLRDDGIGGALHVLPDLLGQIADELLNLGSIAFDFVIDTALSLTGWLWDHKGDIWGGIKAAVGWTTDTFSEAITATITGSIELLGDIGDAAGDLWNWIKRQLWGANGGMGDGTGQQGALTQDITLDDVVIRGAVVLGGMIADVAGDLYGWVKEQLGFGGGGGASGFPGMGGSAQAGGGGIDVGTILVNAALVLSPDINWANLGTSIKENVMAAVARIQWGNIGGAVSTFFTGLWDAFQTADYNRFGVVAGEGIRSAIAAIGPTLLTVGAQIITSLYNGLTQNWQTILKWFALWPILIPAAIVGAAVVLAPKAAEFLQGFLTGLGVNWDGQIAPWLESLPQKALAAVGDFAFLALGIADLILVSFQEIDFTAIASDLADSLVSSVESVDFGAVGASIAQAIWDEVKNIVGGWSVKDFLPGFAGGGGDEGRHANPSVSDPKGGGAINQFTTRWKLDKRELDSGLDEAKQQLDGLAGKAFKSTLDANPQPAIDAVSGVTAIATTFAAQTFRGTLDFNAQPAIAAISGVTALANTFDGSVYTASLNFAVDTSGLAVAEAAARQTAQVISDLLHHASPPRKGPLHDRPATFDSIGADFAAVMGRMHGDADRGMSALSDRLNRRMGVDLAGSGYGGAGGRIGGDTHIGGPTININAPVYGIDDFEDKIIDAYTGKIIPAHIRAMERQNRSLGLSS